MPRPLNAGKARRPRMQPKDCPQCGETMRLVERELTDRVPGTPAIKKRKVIEWVCPECDHFEEADPEDAR